MIDIAQTMKRHLAPAGRSKPSRFWPPRSSRNWAHRGDAGSHGGAEHHLRLDPGALQPEMWWRCDGYDCCIMLYLIVLWVSIWFLYLCILVYMYVHYMKIMEKRWWKHECFQSWIVVRIDGYWWILMGKSGDDSAVSPGESRSTAVARSDYAPPNPVAWRPPACRDVPGHAQWSGLVGLVKPLKKGITVSTGLQPT